MRACVRQAESAPIPHISSPARARRRPSRIPAHKEGEEPGLSNIRGWQGAGSGIQGSGRQCAGRWEKTRARPVLLPGSAGRERDETSTPSRSPHATHLGCRRHPEPQDRTKLHGWVGAGEAGQGGRRLGRRLKYGGKKRPGSDFGLRSFDGGEGSQQFQGQRPIQTGGRLPRTHGAGAGVVGTRAWVGAPRIGRGVGCFGARR